MQSGTSLATDSEVPSTSKGSKERLQPPTPLEIAKDSKLESLYKKMCLQNESIRVKEIFQIILDLAKAQNNNQQIMIFRRVVERSDRNSSEPLIPLPRHLRIKMVSDIMKGRIQDTTVQEMIDILSPHLNESVNTFWSFMKDEEAEQERESVAIKDNLKMDAIFHLIFSKFVGRQWRCRKAKRKLPENLEPTSQLKVLFQNALNRSSEARMSEDISQFARFLQGQQQVERRPLLKNNLLFYIEVQKFKNAHHSNPDKVLLQKKVYVISDCFLTSYLEPRLQIEVDLHQLERALRTSHLYLKGDDTVGDMFDEVQEQVFTELLPYWIIFQQTWNPFEKWDNHRIPDQPGKMKGLESEGKHRTFSWWSLDLLNK